MAYGNRLLNLELQVLKTIMTLEYIGLNFGFANDADIKCFSFFKSYATKLVANVYELNVWEGYGVQLSTWIKTTYIVQYF